MSHATADLEYFMCDMCLTYVHRDIYCPHRRECKGKDSKELKKDEVAAIRRDIENGSDYQNRGGDFNCEGGGGQTVRKSRFSAPLVSCGVATTAPSSGSLPASKLPILTTKRKVVIEQMATLGVRRELEGDTAGMTALQIAGGGMKQTAQSNNPPNDDDDDLEEFFFGRK